MAKKKNNSGRKPIDPSERVILVGFYVKKKVIDMLGGMVSIRDKAKKEMEAEAWRTEVKLRS